MNKGALTKRLIDVSASAAGLVVLAPAMAVIAAAVGLETGAPILFGHERVGRGGSRFKVWKFRTMVNGAQHKGPSVTAARDPRVTRVGAFLRRTKLDELPQLFNVLVGEMSLVGPRPEAPRYVELFADDYRELLEVRPGITDEASILYRDEESVLAGAPDPEAYYVSTVLPRKIRLYQEYVRRPSIRKDLSILARTVLKVIHP